MERKDKEIAIEKIKQILQTHGIRMNVAACGCCDSPWVSFEYQGELIIKDEDNFNFYMMEKEQ